MDNAIVRDEMHDVEMILNLHPATSFRLPAWGLHNRISLSGTGTGLRALCSVKYRFLLVSGHCVSCCAGWYLSIKIFFFYLIYLSTGLHPLHSFHCKKLYLGQSLSLNSSTEVSRPSALSHISSSLISKILDSEQLDRFSAALFAILGVCY